MATRTTMSSSDILLRAEERRRRMSTHRAANHNEAERWDLAFWQAQGPAARLSALAAIRRDVAAVQRARHERHP